MPLDLESNFVIWEGEAPAEPQETLNIEWPNGSAGASPFLNRVPLAVRPRNSNEGTQKARRADTAKCANAAEPVSAFQAFGSIEYRLPVTHATGRGCVGPQSLNRNPIVPFLRIFTCLNPSRRCLPVLSCVIQLSCYTVFFSMDEYSFCRAASNSSIRFNSSTGECVPVRTWASCETPRLSVSDFT